MIERLITLLIVVIGCLTAEASEIFLETESFSRHGGWVVDQQFMDQMGSPYIMAHGMGVPVADATTDFEVSISDTYYIYVRTYNWTSPWTSRRGPGSFQLKVNGKYLSERLGDTGSRWQWQFAGKAKLRKGINAIALHDLTGFDGRCDAVYITTSPVLTDSLSNMTTTQQLRQRLNPNKVTHAGRFDLVVVGGGIAGMCAAVSAARLGSKVALINDRPLWGGNNSSEVRVHLSGIIEVGQYKGLGRLIREFGHSNRGNAGPAETYEDDKKKAFLEAEPNLTLYPSYHLVGVKKANSTIESVTIQNIYDGQQYELEARLFSDCTGDGTLGFLANAHYRMGREAKAEYGESLAPETTDSIVQGASCQWYSEKRSHPSTFPEFSYGVNFNTNNCERVNKGEWKWETGMNRNQITEAERIRDYGMMVIYSNWSWLKNHDRTKKNYANNQLSWVAYVLGKRESRRLLGDYILSEEDINKNVFHEDASFTTTWAIDVHSVDSMNHIHFPGNEFKSQTIHRWIYPYGVPYRCLYSRNVNNLFMAGRNISCTHIALGTVRVMRTTGMMGEVVGMAAAICNKHQALPRDVYHHYLPELQALMQQGVGRNDAPDNQRFNGPNQLLTVPRAFMTRNLYE